MIKTYTSTETKEYTCERLVTMYSRCTPALRMDLDRLHDTLNVCKALDTEDELYYSEKSNLIMDALRQLKYLDVMLSRLDLDSDDPLVIGEVSYYFRTLKTVNNILKDIGVPDDFFDKVIRG